MGGQRALELILGIKDSIESADKLLKTALASSKCRDNVTIIVVHLRNL